MAMTCNVWVIHPDGSAETVRENVPEADAEAFTRHPSMSAAVTTILPTWADDPAPIRNGADR